MRFFCFRRRSLKRHGMVFTSGFLFALLFLYVCQMVSTTAVSLCPDGEWYDFQQGSCRICSVCPADRRLSRSCTPYEDSVCEEGKLNSAPLSGAQAGAGNEVAAKLGGKRLGSVASPPADSADVFTAADGDSLAFVFGQDRSISSSGVVSAGSEFGGLRSVEEDMPRQEGGPSDAAWHGQALAIVGVTGIVVFVVIVVVIGRKLYRRNQQRNKLDVKMLSIRSRLFSRDRLNTTDYMHTLATLDRKMAMDEILEKRRRAVFLQEIKCDEGNQYSDEVFLDFYPPMVPPSGPENIDSASAGKLSFGQESRR